jgi:hypothetical protein
MELMLMMTVTSEVIEVLVWKMSYFFIDPPCLLYFYIFSNTANGVDKLAGNDNVESLRKRNKVLAVKLDCVVDEVAEIKHLMSRRSLCNIAHKTQDDQVR